MAILKAPLLWRPERTFTDRDNVQIAEAQAWWQGRLNLSQRYWDTALVGDLVYSHFPPLFSMMAALVIPFTSGFPHWLVVLTTVLPLIVLPYWLFTRLTGTVLGGLALSVAFIGGTSLWPVLDRVLRNGNPWFVNSSLATLGLLIFLLDYTGRRRIWPGAIGLVAASFSRQFTFFYFFALAAAAWNSSNGACRWRRVSIVAAAAMVVFGTYAVFNATKFGHPLDSGYMKLYDPSREDKLARDARTHGLFSWHYIPQNLYYTNVGLPISVDRHGRSRPNPNGTGIWWTTPLLLWVLWDARRLWKDRDAQPLLFCAAAIYLALLFYHSTGYAQRGYNRYSLDYLPILFTLVAPRILTGRRLWLTLVFAAWGVVYFFRLA